MMYRKCEWSSVVNRKIMNNENIPHLISGMLMTLNVNSFGLKISPNSNKRFPLFKLP